jgi:hypothetical protein
MGALAKAPGPSRVDSPTSNVEQRVDCGERINGTLRRPAPVLSERDQREASETDCVAGHIGLEPANPSANLTSQRVVV